MSVWVFSFSFLLNFLLLVEENEKYVLSICMLMCFFSNIFLLFVSFQLNLSFRLDLELGLFLFLNLLRLLLLLLFFRILELKFVNVV